MTAATAPAKPKAKRPAKAIVSAEAGPDLAALEQFINDATAAQQSAISPDDMVRKQFITGLRVTEAKIAALDEQASLARRLAEALLQNFADHRARLERAAQRYRNGLLDGAETQERTAAQ